jgi:hypothetical protein
VWNRFSSYIATTNGVPYDAVTQRSAFDRHSGEAVTCCGAAISSAAGTYTGPQSGLAFTWPIGAGQQPYQVFDTVLHRPVTAAFSGTSAIAGIPVSKYTEQVRAAKVGTQKLPGQLVGLKGQATATLDEFYQTTATYWVDPVTGTALEQFESYAPEVVQGLHALAGTRCVEFLGETYWKPPMPRRPAAPQRDRVHHHDRAAAARHLRRGDPGRRRPAVGEPPPPAVPRRAALPDRRHGPVAPRQALRVRYLTGRLTGRAQSPINRSSGDTPAMGPLGGIGVPPGPV